MDSPIAFYKALADETRLLSLLLIVKENELCVCEIMQALQESQPKISRHLAQLRKAGLLQDRRQGQWVFYQICDALPQWMKQVLQDTYQNNSSYIATCVARLVEMGDRPARANKCC